MQQVQSNLVEWKALFPKITMNVFKLADHLATANKGVKMGADTLKKRKTEKATKDTQAALDEVDESTGISVRYLSAIRKEARTTAQQMIRADQTKERKKSSGGAKKGKSQASRPGKNGQGTNNSAGGGRKNSNVKSSPASPNESKSGKGQKGKHKGKSQSKSKGTNRKVQFQTTKNGKKQPQRKNQKSDSNKEGDQGESRRGGKRKRAGRR